MSVRVNVHTAEIRAYFYTDAGPVVPWARDLTEQVRNAAVRRAPRDTGALAASLEQTFGVYGNRLQGSVGSRLDYAAYVVGGTGIYGPRHTPIRPVRARALRFKPGRLAGPLPAGRRGTSPERRGPWVFARSVRGTQPNPFLVAALEDVLPGRVHILVSGLGFWTP